jgi:hypothetical protein
VITACEASRQTSLPGAIQNLRDEITEVHERAGQSRGDAEAERQNAETWSDEVEEEGPTWTRFGTLSRMALTGPEMR